MDTLWFWQDFLNQLVLYNMYWYISLTLFFFLDRNASYNPHRLISLIVRQICVIIGPMGPRVLHNWALVIPRAFPVAVCRIFVIIANPVEIYLLPGPINRSITLNTTESCVIPIILVDVPVVLPGDIVSVNPLVFWMKSIIPVLFGFKTTSTATVLYYGKCKRTTISKTPIPCHFYNSEFYCH